MWYYKVCTNKQQGNLTDKETFALTRNGTMQLGQNVAK